MVDLTEWYSVIEAIERLNDELTDDILDYVFEHYPTQATISAMTRSPQGLREREMMRKDEILRKLTNYGTEDDS